MFSPDAWVLQQLNIPCGQETDAVHVAGTPIKVSNEDSQPMFPGVQEDIPDDKDWVFSIASF